MLDEQASSTRKRRNIAGRVLTRNAGAAGEGTVKTDEIKKGMRRRKEKENGKEGIIEQKGGKEDEKDEEWSAGEGEIVFWTAQLEKKETTFETTCATLGLGKNMPEDYFEGIKYVGRER